MSPRPESERSDWTELDLLTVVEAADRVRDEIVDTEHELAALADERGPARELLERRLDALRTLADRYADAGPA